MATKATKAATKAKEIKNTKGFEETLWGALPDNYFSRLGLDASRKILL